MSISPTDSPYKFLDSYEEADREIFFGRERETQILLADIVVSGLVLLFAETGTGKTSLIRAGVTPLLTDREYVTFFVRTSEDPAISLRDELSSSGRRLRKLGLKIKDGELVIDDELPLAPQLEHLALRLQLPLVFFLDQFEEFFLYIFRRDRERALRFVADVGALQRSPDAHVHVVFSMREDSVGKMDVFRDEVPAIFHRESNLRLRPFDEDQARAAISGPARARNVVIAEELETELVRDLTGVDGIDPTELQIVCDTLWRSRANGRIELETYHDLDRGEPGTIARSILAQRLEEEFATRLEVPQLDLLAELLPRLRTPVELGHVPTKYVRDLDGLASELAVDREELDALVEELKHARVVRQGLHPNLIELTHDYLVGGLDRLAWRVKGIAPRKALDEAMRADDPEQLSTSLDDILGRIEHLELDAAHAEFLLRVTLARGRQMQTQLLLERAEAAGVDVWSIVRERLSGPEPDAVQAVDLLSGLVGQREEAVVLLSETLVGDEELGARILDVLETKLEAVEAVDVVAAAVRHAPLRTRAQAALVALAGSGNPTVADAAADALLGQLRDAGNAPKQIVATLEAYAAVEVLERAVHDDRLAEPAEDALVRLASSPNPGVAARASQGLADRLERALDDPGQASQAVARLAELDTLRAVQLLARARARPPLADEATRALRRLTESTNEVVAARARDELGIKSASTPVESPRKRERARAPSPAPPRPTSLATVADTAVAVVLDRLLDGRVVPFLGPGAASVDRPRDLGWQPGGPYLPTGRELAAYLAEDFRYPYPEGANTAAVCDYAEIMIGLGPLYRELRSFFNEDYPPNQLHQLIARLPAILRQRDRRLPLIITTALDDSLERAFTEVAEPYEVLAYVAHGPHAGSFLHREYGGLSTLVTSGARSDVGLDDRSTIILRVFGGVDRSNPEGDSFLVTTDAIVDFLAHGGGRLPVAVAAHLRENHLLFLGFGISDWGNRTILRRIASELFYRSWAIIYEPDEVEKSFWRSRDVDVLDRSLDDYVHQLADALASVES